MKHDPHRSAAEPTSPTAGALWSLRVLALGALLGSGFLFFESLGAGPALPGCGAASACDAVMNSRWSLWLGVSVAGPAMGVYALLLAMSWQLGPRRSPGQRRLAALTMAATAMATVGAAAWFVGVQVFAIGELCAYCSAVHAMGVAAAGVAAAIAWRGRLPLDRKAFGNAASLAAIGLLALVAGQASAPPLAGPDARQAIEQNATDTGIVHDTGPGPERELVLAVGSGRVRISPREYPVLGSPDAPLLLVAMLDYTCSHCRAMHRDLVPVREQYGDRLGVVMLPTPLDASCNPQFTSTAPAHREACDLARLALAVWRADPAQFEAFDHWLAGREPTRTRAAARARAGELVGEAALEQALADPWVQQQPGRNAAMYVLAGGGALPQLVGPDVWLRGRPRNLDAAVGELIDRLPDN